MSIAFSAQRIQRMADSATMEITRQANQMQARGVDVISLSAGLPDFDTPQHIKQAGIEAINAGQTRYTNVDGTDELKLAIIDDLIRRKSLHYQADQILISNGAKQSLFNAIMASINNTDEVIIPAPYWVSYPEMVSMANGQVVIVNSKPSSQYKMNAVQLADSISPKTRALILNSPSNPTGQRYTESELKALAKVLMDNPHVLIISDEIYDQVHWSEQATVNLLEVEPKLVNRYLLINGLSKSHAMTGWRIGYAAGPNWLIKAMRKIQGHSTSNACSISQAAAVAALSGDQSFINVMNRAYASRHQLAMQKIVKLEGLSAQPCESTFYLLVDATDAIHRCGFADDIDLAKLLLAEVAVATVPGSAFGCPYHLRLSIASSEQNISTAFDRIGKFLQTHTL